MSSIEVWLYYPHSSVFIWPISNTREPVNKGAGVCDATVSKRKKKSNTCHIKATHAVFVWVGVDKHAIVPWRALTPGRCCTNMLATHASNTTNITGCKECCCGRVVDGDFCITTEFGEI